jgi:hypothetical protein
MPTFAHRSTTSREALGTLVRSRHFWIVVGMLVACTIVHYATPQNRVIPLAGITLTRHTIERVIFLLPIAAASFAFG